MLTSLMSGILCLKCSNHSVPAATCPVLSLTTSTVYEQLSPVLSFTTSTVTEQAAQDGPVLQYL